MKNYIGNPLQTRGCEKYVLQEGKGDGMHFLYIRNGLGLEAWISLDRCGDVSRVNFMGQNMGYFAPCGYVAPQYYDGVGAGFLKSFTAGFFTTCGLSAVGAPCVDDGEELGLHGTISNIPAELLGISETKEGLTITLRVRDAVIFGRKLTMLRTYEFSYTENSFEVTDTVQNDGDKESPYMILYHCNMGYPLLSENAILKIPHTSLSARDDEAQKYISTALEVEQPKAQFIERCYYYDVVEKGGFANVGIYNKDIDKGLVLTYDKTSLPCFTEWKMLGNQDYVLGLEPGNCNPDGRDVIRKSGKLEFLSPDERKTTKIKFEFLNNNKKFMEMF